MIDTTTSLFFHGVKRSLQGARPVPVPAPGAVMVSRDGQSFVAAPVSQVPAPAPMLATQTRFTGQAWVSPAPPKPLVETIPLGPKATFVSTPGFDMMGTEEEKIGPRAKAASLVGGL